MVDIFCLNPRKDSIDFHKLPATAQAKLARLSERVAGIVPIDINSWRLATVQLQTGAQTPTIVDKVARWARKESVYIYAINLVENQTDLSEIIKAFASAKVEQKDRAYPRMNKPSLCFYVGSSRHIHQRLKEHLGYGAKGTYALHLAQWAGGLHLELECICARYQAGYEAEVYQVLEDTLWNELSPMFGRRGAK